MTTKQFVALDPIKLADAAVGAVKYAIEKVRQGTAYRIRLTNAAENKISELYPAVDDADSNIVVNAMEMAIDEALKNK